MQAGRQAYGLAGRRLFSTENDVFASTCVSWTFAVLVYVCEADACLVERMMSAMLQCIVLDGAAEHATLLVSLAHHHKCEAVEPKSLAHVVSILSCEC